MNPILSALIASSKPLLPRRPVGPPLVNAVMLNHCEGHSVYSLRQAVFDEVGGLVQSALVIALNTRKLAPHSCDMGSLTQQLRTRTGTKCASLRGRLSVNRHDHNFTGMRRDCEGTAKLALARPSLCKEPLNVEQVAGALGTQ